MSAFIINGQALAESVQTDLKRRSEEVRLCSGKSPKLGVVLVGSNPASKVYVKSKTKKARACGIEVQDLFLDESTSNDRLQQELRTLSAEGGCDGILLQLPLPKHLDEQGALLCIDPRLDADGLHPYNQGCLMRGTPAPEPCTPKGCMMLIDRAREELGLPRDLSGLHAAVVGRSILVGKPAALMLLSRHCTVSLCHSRTKDLAAECRRADILIAAVGRPRMLGREYIKPGAIVIDVGINRTENGDLAGDVDFDQALEAAGAVTPVPGGVGPMTIAMLLANTVDSARRRAGLA